MRYLAIDYGTKKTGLALSDETGTIAFPHSIIPTTDHLANELVSLVDKEGVSEIVIGHSLDQAGQENDLMVAIHDLIGQLSLLVSVPVHLQTETFTSVEARRRPGFDGLAGRRQSSQRGRKSVSGQVDDRAAALILQRYLDKQK